MKKYVLVRQLRTKNLFLVSSEVEKNFINFYTGGLCNALCLLSNNGDEEGSGYNLHSGHHSGFNALLADVRYEALGIPNSQTSE